jgi:hypothetical protein
MCYPDYVCMKLGEARVQQFLEEAERGRLIMLCRARSSPALDLMRIAPLGMTIFVCLVLIAILAR